MKALFFSFLSFLPKKDGYPYLVVWFGLVWFGVLL